MMRVHITTLLSSNLIATILLVGALIAPRCTNAFLPGRIMSTSKRTIHKEPRPNTPVPQANYEKNSKMRKYTVVKGVNSAAADDAKTTKSKLVAFPGRAGALHPVKKAFTLSHNEICISILQLALLLTMIRLVRIPSIANWTTKLFQCFPYVFMFDYEHLSLVDWVIHYSALVYNIRVISGLWTMQNDNDGKVSMKRRSFAIGVTGLGHVLGISLMISHSLIGTGSPAQQAFHNFSAFLMKFTAMSIGGFMMLPPVGSIFYASAVTFAIMKGLVSFQNAFGILLTNVGLMAILTSSKRDFPVKFKIGYLMLTFFPAASIIIDKTLGGHTDLGHTLGAIWLSLSTILQRWSLI